MKNNTAIDVERIMQIQSAMAYNPDDKQYMRDFSGGLSRLLVMRKTRAEQIQKIDLSEAGKQTAYYELDLINLHIKQLLGLI